MPIDNQNKISHILSTILRTFTGEQKTVVLVYQSAGVYSYATVRPSSNLRQSLIYKFPITLVLRLANNLIY